MKYDFNREWLAKKFDEVRNRTLSAIGQLDDNNLNWSPDNYSNNIPTLLRHIEGNIKERIIRGICKEDIFRDREKEFSKTYMTREEAEILIKDNFQIVIDVIRNITDGKFEEVQIVRGKERSNLDMLHQCAAHYSEHMGQILYITKQCLGNGYKTTTV